MANEHEDKKRTLREEWRLSRRAVRIIHKEVPGFWRDQVLASFAAVIFPYFGLFMSAQILNELAGECDVRRLFLLATVTVSGSFAVSFFARWLNGRKDLTGNFMWVRTRAVLGNAQNEFQYEHLESAETALLRSRILEAANAFGGGLLRVAWSAPKVISYGMEIVLSASLTISMFTLTAKGEFTGIFRLINSRCSVIAVLGILVINIINSVRISTKKAVEAKEALAGLAKYNTWWGVIGSLEGPDMIAFDLNKIVLEEFRKKNISPKWLSDTEKISIRYGKLIVIQDIAMSAVIFLYTAVKAYIGAFGIGNFILYQGTVQRFVQAVSSLAAEMGELRHNNNYLTEVYEFLDLPNSMYKGTLAVEKRDDIDYEVEFKDVSFQYPRTDTWALRHVNMKFKIGEKLAIVGENGSGKTTFIKLLCRLYDPTEGKILLNGIDITRYRYDEYMALFSVVFQDFTLFGFPLGENVSAGNTYDTQKARDCLIRAGLEEKLASLDREEIEPLQRGIGRDYDAEGIDFSGGEKQKIALARALYKDAPFVILDEPTAALDPIAEAEVYEKFNKIVENKTAVFISHRLSSCKFCHNIAVFDHGELIQKGSHEELIAEEQGKYSQLWNAQAKYYQEKAG